MCRGLLLFFLLSISRAFGGNVQPLPALPNGAIATAIQIDAAGNLYVAGTLLSNPQDPTAPGHIFVGKLSSDALRVLWWITLAGTDSDVANALVLGSDNSVYVTGTASIGFPTTPGSMQPTATFSGQTFAAKLDPNGKVIYSTYIGGSAQTTGAAIAVDSLGHAFITGYLQPGAVFPTTPGAIIGAVSSQFSTAYIMELNPTGSAAELAIQGFGGFAIALDSHGNIYAGGAFVGPLAPTTSGAFQTTTVQAMSCFSSFVMVEYCVYQHIAKIDPTGTRLIYATYLAGTYGAFPSAIAVDAQGNVIVAGNTNSPDYPTTPSAYQPQYFAYSEPGLFPPHEVGAPATAGYVSKLNATGSALIFSTFLTGSGTINMLQTPGTPNVAAGDQISAMRIDANGNIMLSGVANSNDLPGLWSTPVAQRPGTMGEGFVTRLSGDGTILSPTQLIAGSTQIADMALRADGSAVVVPAIANVTVSSIGRVAAICDTADNAKIVRVAPGQLLTLFGTMLAPEAEAFRSSGATVTFNGIPAPILYTSSTQINLQVPYEIAALTEITMLVSSQSVSPALSESYILAVAARQPSVFLSSAGFGQSVFDSTTCNGQTVSGVQPLALNADGTENSCTNPASSGSTVTIFLNGLGIISPVQTTGTVSSSTVAISPAANFIFGSAAATNFLSTTTLPGSIASIAQVQIQVTSTSPVLNIPMLVGQPPDAYWVRGSGILIWVKPAK